ncbi:IniB N-terminal domain-containing protein [Mycolicibacterium sp. XJ1819]
MSILDFTTELFREPATLRGFVDDPQQALAQAGFPDATPEQIYDLMPLVAESMPPDHPLQEVAHAADPAAALRALDIDEVIADSHDHHRDVAQIEKAIGTPETLGAVGRTVVCGPGADPEPSVKAISTTDLDTGATREKALGEEVADDPLTPQIEGAPELPDVEYPDVAVAHELVGDGLDEPLDEPQVDSVVWGKALE